MAIEKLKINYKTQQ